MTKSLIGKLAAMNVHLSIFRPYQDRHLGHEDQLTRASLIVMRAVPLAHEAFLDLAAQRSVSRLPPARFDMQTGRVDIAEVDRDGSMQPEVDELVSVFLTPDQTRPEQVAALDVDSERRARYDGVVSYGSRLLIVIESKLRRHAPADQAEHVNLGGVRAATRSLRHVRWHELLERWLVLIEQPLPAPAERVAMSDFFDFAEEHFAPLLPFTSLARCGENEVRRGRRLRRIFHEATGLAVEEHRSATVRFDYPGRVKSFQRAVLQDHGDNLDLSVWLGELKPQAQHLYGDETRVENIAALCDEDDWKLRPNPHVAFWQAPPHQRWYTTCLLSPQDYLHQWIADLDKAGRTISRNDLQDGTLWHWLIDRGYAQPHDRPGLERLLETRVDNFDMRPSTAVSRRWSWLTAVELDGDGRHSRLVEEVRAAVDHLLAILDEPQLAALSQS